MDEEFPVMVEPDSGRRAGDPIEQPKSGLQSPMSRILRCGARVVAECYGYPNCCGAGLCQKNFPPGNSSDPTDLIPANVVATSVIQP
jgi:hypothetical protein